MRARQVRHLSDTEGEHQLIGYTLGAYSPRPGPDTLGSVNVFIQLGLNWIKKLQTQLKSAADRPPIS